MVVRSWHGGKIAIVWLVAGVIWPLLRALFPSPNMFSAMMGGSSGYTGEQVTMLWIVVAVLPAAAITWRWLSGKESA